MLELDRVGELAAGDEAVHVAFGDEHHLLDSAGRLKGVAIRDTLAMLCDCVTGVAVSECGGDVLRAEQHRPVLGGHRATGLPLNSKGCTLDSVILDLLSI